jgi:iron(III) transport system substrate-binding protein
MISQPSGHRARRVAVAVFLLVTMGLTDDSAAEGGVVNVRTSREPAFVEPLLRVFEELTQIKLNLVYVKDGLVEQVAAEGDNSTADLLLASEFNQLIEAKARGITQPAAIQALTDHIPPALRDAGNHWFGVSQRARVVFASRQRVAQDTFTYEELADPKWKGRICSRPGSHPYNVGLIASLLAHKGEAWTEQWLRGVKANLAMKPAGGDRDQIANVHAGKCDIAIANTYYFGAMQANDSSRHRSS